MSVETYALLYKCFVMALCTAHLAVHYEDHFQNHLRDYLWNQSPSAIFMVYTRVHRQSTTWVYKHE